MSYILTDGDITYRRTGIVARIKVSDTKADAIFKKTKNLPITKRVLSMRSKGLTYKQIGVRMGFSRQTAHYYVNKN